MNVKIKKRLPSVGTALAVCALLLALGLAGCAPAAEGAAVEGDVLYVLDAQKMTGTELHTAELREGSVLQIRFETVKGSMYMEIIAPDGAAVYGGNGTEATEFTLNIHRDGVYTFRVEARRASGNICVSLKEAAEPDVRETDTAAETAA